MRGLAHLSLTVYYSEVDLQISKNIFAGIWTIFKKSGVESIFSFKFVWKQNFNRFIFNIYI